MGRYGFGILMFFVGAFVLWASTGFKNPWRGMGINGAAGSTAGNGTGTGNGNGNGGGANGGTSGNGTANG